jgi:hypothetical protein
VDIIVNPGLGGGWIDVDENGAIDGLDDLLDVDLNDRTSGLTQNSGTRGRNQVDFIDGRVDVDENGVIDNLDTLTNIHLLY